MPLPVFGGPPPTGDAGLADGMFKDKKVGVLGILLMGAAGLAGPAAAWITRNRRSYGVNEQVKK